MHFGFLHCRHLAASASASFFPYPKATSLKFLTLSRGCCSGIIVLYFFNRLLPPDFFLLTSIIYFFIKLIDIFILNYFYNLNTIKTAFRCKLFYFLKENYNLKYLGF